MHTLNDHILRTDQNTNPCSLYRFEIWRHTAKRFASLSVRCKRKCVFDTVLHRDCTSIASGEEKSRVFQSSTQSVSNHRVSKAHTYSLIAIWVSVELVPNCIELHIWIQWQNVCNVCWCAVFSWIPSFTSNWKHIALPISNTSCMFIIEHIVYGFAALWCVRMEH